MVADRNGARPGGDGVSPPLALAGALVAFHSLHIDQISREPLIATGDADVFLVFLDELLVQAPGWGDLVVEKDQHHSLLIWREEKGEQALGRIGFRDVLPTIRQAKGKIVLRELPHIAGKNPGGRSDHDGAKQGEDFADWGQVHKQ
jgi:hypothetical protein